MAKSEELVMAVPAAELFRPGHIQGLQLGGEAWLRLIFDPRLSRFLPRAAAEQDPGWKQVIPYVVLESGGQVFIYRRGLKSSETRLHALHAIGLGGHIRHSDESVFTPPGWPAYSAALERELAEEVAIGAEVVEDRLVGLINDDTTEVGRVHIGLLHLRRLAAPVVSARESKIAAGRFARVEQLRGPEAPECETWSRICLQAWTQVAAQPGWRAEAES